VKEMKITGMEEEVIKGKSLRDYDPEKASKIKPKINYWSNDGDLNSDLNSLDSYESDEGYITKVKDGIYPYCRVCGQIMDEDHDGSHALFYSEIDRIEGCILISLGWDAIFEDRFGRYSEIDEETAIKIISPDF